jgi:hypothetical protein
MSSRFLFSKSSSVRFLFFCLLFKDAVFALEPGMPVAAELRHARPAIAAQQCMLAHLAGVNDIMVGCNGH